MIIRLAAEPDVPVLRSIAAVAYQPYLARIGRPPAPVNADYAALVALGDAWVAVADGEVTGLIVLMAGADHLLVDNLAVLPSAQRRGVGTRLLEFADARARELGLAEVRLYTNAAMTENLGYYPRRGYAETHRAEQDGFSRVFFTKRL